LVMATLIKEAKSVNDLPRAFRAFDHVRRERTQRLVSTSQETGMIYDFELLGDDLDKIQKAMQSRLHWIWDFDLGEHLEEAKKAFHSDSLKS